MPINAFAVADRGAKLDPFAYEPALLGPHDIEIAISHCGICHSDIHLIDNDWGVSTYPLVPGHEIIGAVTDRGKMVTQFKNGDRVGVGWQRGSCHTCDDCVSANENYCHARTDVCVGHFGGFAESIHTDARFAFKIPDDLPSEGTAPLLCGGITVFSPLKTFGVRSWHRVGVVGIGGLGHLAVKFAKALGCEVTVFSSAAAKQKEAVALGASRFFVSTDHSAVMQARNSLDFIISTVFSDMPWHAYVQALKTDGTLCLVGASSAPVSLPTYLLMNGRKRLASSVIGSPADIRDMLVFSARHGIVAQTEAVPLQDVNAAIKKVREGRARYRMVLAMG